MDAVRTENKALSARFSEIRQIHKETRGADCFQRYLEKPGN